MMRRDLLRALLACGVLTITACSDPGGVQHDVEHFSVRYTQVQQLDESGQWVDFDLSEWSSEDPEEISERLSYAERTRVTVEIIARPDEGSFDGFVQVAVVPGDVLSLASERAEVTRRGVRVASGEPTVATVDFEGSFGEARIMVEETGHLPAAPEEAACDDGEDNDGDGLVDYPNDPGCFLRNDDSEQQGSHAVGVSEPVYFSNPRLNDVQGCGLIPTLERQSVTVDRGAMYVTAVTVNGFYVTDFGRYPDGGCDPASGCCDGGRYAHLFAYNFNTPWGLRVCDRLASVGGIVGDFYGFTELNFPHWERYDLDPSTDQLDLMRLEPHDITADDCPILSWEINSSMLTNRILMESYESALVHVTEATLPTEWINCDYNGNGAVAYNAAYDEFAPADEVEAVLGDYFSDYCTPVDGMCSEVECNDTCIAHTCAELTNYREYGQYPVLVGDMPVLVVTSTNIPGFNPYRMALDASGPVTLHRIGGVLKEFAPLDMPWIIEPRCPQDLYIEGDPTFGSYSEEDVPIWRRCVPSEETGDYEDPY